MAAAMANPGLAAAAPATPAQAAPADGPAEGLDEPMMIVGILKFQLTFVYNCLTVLNACQREQYNFWRAATTTAKARLLYFEVLEHAALPAAVPLRRYERRTPRVFIQKVEVGQALQLAQALAPDAHCWAGDAVDTVVVLPARFAVSLARGDWASFAVSLLPRGWALGMHHLGSRPRQAERRARRAARAASSLGDGAPLAGREVLRPGDVWQLADTLMELLNSSQQAALPGMLDEARLWVKKLRRYHDAVFLNHDLVRELRSHGAYGIMTLMNCFWTASFLKSSDTLTEALCWAARSTLTPALAEEVKDKPTRLRNVVPSKSALCKHRLTLDAALVVEFRERLAAMLRGGD